MPSRPPAATVSYADGSVTTAAIFGCSGHRLTEAERAFFAGARPWGFILFRRNIDSPDQVRALTAELRDSIGDEHAPILIDQEGGRVQRMAKVIVQWFHPQKSNLMAWCESSFLVAKVLTIDSIHRRPSMLGCSVLLQLRA